VVASLEGLRVVEVASWMAAPGATAILVDLGAEVVKVEPLRGDTMRKITRQPELPDGRTVDTGFEVDNRGKRSIAVAVNTPDGADIVRRLAARADVFVNNLLGRRQQRFGLDADTLLEANPRLVHATLTGYGLEGPDAERPGYDITAFFGRGGITHTITEPGCPAPRARPAQGDHMTALALVASVLAALRLVERTGEGQVIDVNLMATAAWAMATDLSGTLVDGRNPPTQGRRNRIHALQESFRCADDRFLLLFMPEPHWWPRFCEAVGRPEWIDDPRLATVPARAKHMSEVTDLMDELFATRTLAEWGRLFDEHGFIWGPASTVAEFAADEQAASLGLFPEVDHPVAGRLRTVANPLRIRGADHAPRGPAPDVGAHTHAVLAELGIPDHDIAVLAADGVVGPPSLTEEPAPRSAGG
jgi:crotonobetainyl-CoA:carnitine CoA-transferase CaiB-like acyl-CoA transferase